MNTINIVGLGASDSDQLSLKVLNFLKGFNHLYLRTTDHPAVSYLIDQGYQMKVLSNLYEKYGEDFDSVYPSIARQLQALAEKKKIVYVVPGHQWWQKKQ